MKRKQKRDYLMNKLWISPQRKLFKNICFKKTFFPEHLLFLKLQFQKMRLVTTTCVCASDSITSNPRVRPATETSALFDVKGTKRVKITEFGWNEEMHWMQISD